MKYKITVNSSEQEVDSHMKLGELIKSQQPDVAGMAAAVNGRIVKREDWDTIPLNEGDNILLIKAAYGG